MEQFNLYQRWLSYKQCEWLSLSARQKEGNQRGVACSLHDEQSNPEWPLDFSAKEAKVRSCVTLDESSVECWRRSWELLVRSGHRLLLGVGRLGI